MRSFCDNRSYIIAGFTLCNLFAWLLAGHFLIESKQQHERYAEVQSRNIAKAIDQSISSSIERVDLVLLAIADELEHRRTGEGRSAPGVEGLLASYQKRIPELASLRTTNAEGMVVYGKGDSRTTVSYAELDFFPLLRDHADLGLYITEPMVGRTSHRWMIGLIRRYNLPGGGFAGVVTASIPIEHFNLLLSRFDIGAQGGITLVTGRFGLVARYPVGPGGAFSEIGKTVASPELRKLVQSGRVQATFRTRTSPNHAERVLSFHRLTVAPMITTVGLAEEDYLMQWREDAVLTCLMVGCFLLLSLGSAILLLKSLSRIERESAKRLEVNEHLMEVIDEYQITAEELRESERRYSALFANRLNAVAHCRILTDQSGRPVDYLILRVNEAFERIIGIRKGDIEGRQVTAVFQDFRGSAFDYIGVFGQIALEGGETQFESFFEPTQQYLSIYAYSPLPSEFTTIMTDVTERKRAEEALRVSESKLRIIFDNEVFAILIFDPDTGKILDFNETHVSMYGYSREELNSGMSAFQLTADFDRSHDSVRQIRNSTTIFVPLRYHQKKGGTVFPVEIVGGAYQWNGRRVMFALVHDITERVKAEQTLKRYAKRLIEQEEELRKTVSRELHDDIGQELTALGLNLAYLWNSLRDETGGSLRNTLEDSRSLTKEISRTVRNLMVDLRPPQLDEYGLAGAIRSYADQYAQRTGLDVAVEIDQFARLSSEQEIALFRITQEALNNAAKYSAATTLTITLSSDPSRMQLCIADDGDGFLPEEVGLEPVGSGWGLAIMRERAELAGGSFRIHSAPGAGTTVVVEIFQPS